MTDSKSIHIVRLDGIYSADPTFNIPHTFTSHPNTPPDDTIIASHLQTADVVITTRVPISAVVLDACPNLKLYVYIYFVPSPSYTPLSDSRSPTPHLRHTHPSHPSQSKPDPDQTTNTNPILDSIAISAIGSDHIDLAAAKAHKIPVCNVPAANSEAVAEHAISFYFALRRHVIKMHELTAEGIEWVERGSLAKEMGELPRTCREEVLGILGVGNLVRLTLFLSFLPIPIFLFTIERKNKQTRRR